jgi:hypothetical protein
MDAAGWRFTLQRFTARPWSAVAQPDPLRPKAPNVRGRTARTLAKLTSETGRLAQTRARGRCEAGCRVVGTLSVVGGRRAGVSRSTTCSTAHMRMRAICRSQDARSASTPDGSSGAARTARPAVTPVPGPGFAAIPGWVGVLRPVRTAGIEERTTRSGSRRASAPTRSTSAPHRGAGPKPKERCQYEPVSHVLNAKQQAFHEMTLSFVAYRLSVRRGQQRKPIPPGRGCRGLGSGGSSHSTAQVTTRTRRGSRRSRLRTPPAASSCRQIESFDGRR